MVRDDDVPRIFTFATSGKMLSLFYRMDGTLHYDDSLVNHYYRNGQPNKILGG
jgi:hypothetical protein